MKPVRNSSANVKVREGRGAGASGSTADIPTAALGQGHFMKELQSVGGYAGEEGRYGRKKEQREQQPLHANHRASCPPSSLHCWGGYRNGSALEPGRSRRRDINVCLHFSLSASGLIDYKLALIFCASSLFRSQ